MEPLLQLSCLGHRNRCQGLGVGLRIGSIASDRPGPRSLRSLRSVRDALGWTPYSSPLFQEGGLKCKEMDGRIHHCFEGSDQVRCPRDRDRVSPIYNLLGWVNVNKYFIF